MIDKNDVKMPVQRENIESLLSDKDKVRKIEDLLDMVSEVENKQELRLKSDYYSRFHWFGASAGKNDKSYFSYQEEAVYDFIFNLNKSGILSDQVGMGKTIEAGMIISELASRNELRSLLIVVPNEIMAQKWEYELEEKFGIKPYRRLVNNVEEIYPEVKAIKNFDDFSKCVFECLSGKFTELAKHRFVHQYKATPNSTDTLDGIIKGYVNEDIKTVLKLINMDLEDDDDDIQVVFDGNKFSISGTKFEKAYTYDERGDIKRYLRGKQNQRMLENTINNAFFVKQYERLIKQELTGLYTLLGEYFTTLPDKITTVAKMMAKKYPILVVPISYSETINDKIIHHPFLNKELLPEIKNYKHQYMIQGKEGCEPKYESYRVIDYFIDVAYQTLIVDEVHDYIDVAAKIERTAFHKNNGFAQYPSDTYDRYELFDDYYFIKKSSLYKKLKSLADKASRKIFLTATPIKSDMVDFYLLTLLASNKDADAYKNIEDKLVSAFPMRANRDAAVETLFQRFKDCIECDSEKEGRDGAQCAVQFFTGRRSEFLKREKDESGAETGHFIYPYFNNSFLLRNTGEKLIRDYIINQVAYMSMEEVIMELILAYNAEVYGSSDNNTDMRELMNSIGDLLMPRDSSEYQDLHLQTRVVFRALLNNNIKIRFEEDFTTADGKYIKRIRQLLDLDDGARKWNKTYHKYGIRHTRHQTYNLEKCAELNKLSQNRIERYKNLPLWPKRDGKVIFLFRDDSFFDCLVDVKRKTDAVASSEIRMEDLPNFDRLLGSEEEKKERFESSKAIFDYINGAMSGGSPTTHEPSSIKFDSIDISDAGMVEYKLALVNMLMLGRAKNSGLGAVDNKVLLFAENNRDEIVDWFRYQQCEPLYHGEELNENKMREYEEKWHSYQVEKIGADWKVSEDAEDLSRYDGKLLIIIDPKRYEKGVDLQKADTIINFDINYDPLKMEQRIGRIDRIRPTGKVPQINIVSFVPMNDMSGFVINFFANELKMFTQWMGETTGIVSVEEEENKQGKGEDVSFEGKVYGLEKFYKYMYNICNGEVSDQTIETMAKEFRDRFGDEVDVNQAIIDFRFLRKLRSDFDTIFRNSVSPQRSGYLVNGKPGSKVMRFNSAVGITIPCGSGDCKTCPNARDCKRNDGKNKVRNNYNSFRSAVEDFFTTGAKFYQDERKEFQSRANNLKIFSDSSAMNRISSQLEKNASIFNTKAKEVKALLAPPTGDPFTMPIEKCDSIIKPIKELYWDAVVYKYLGLVIKQFHKQCDSVLKGARLFERFVKTLSIADFMKNMEGMV